jgi:hypothetical protein
MSTLADQDVKYGLFFPETNERYMPSKDFATCNEAEEYLAQKSGFEKTQAQGQDDYMAWMNSWTGDIYVLRRI